MAEESPLSPSSENSPVSHKRPITDMVTPHDHQPINNTSQNPTLNLSLLTSETESSTLELGIAETQETHSFPEQSPKKPKFCSLNHSLAADKSCISDDTPQFVEKISNLDDAKGKYQENVSEIEQFGGEMGSSSSSSSSKEELEFDGNNEVSELKLEKTDLGFEQKEVADEFSQIKAENLDGVLQRLLKKEDSKRSLKIEMMDGTALVDVSLLKNQRRGNKKGHSRNITSVSGVTNGGKKKFVYTRKELELLRYVNVKAQRKFWQEIYDGFSATVKKDYGEVGSFRHHKNGVSSSDFGGKKNYHDGGILGTCSTVPYYNNRGILGESCSENESCEAEIVSSSTYVHEGHNSGEEFVGELIEDEESDDEYECIHRPAFKVEGEPDFESGSPEDGFEYLRRVRWEAKQIPKVKIAKLDNIKPKGQSVYMPEIPDIEECPPHLVPLRQWEDEFVADFAKLRLELSRLDDASDAACTESESFVFARHGPKNHSHSENSASVELTSGGPILSTVLEMDPVSRVTMLRRRISLFENASDLSKDDCAWLFALCAVVDTPLDADTSASLRCLLRYCSKLRAAKSEVDDEVIMLNVLATISGRFFGQSKN